MIRIRLVERGGLEPGIGSKSLRIDQIATQTNPKFGGANKLTDAHLRHIQKKFTVVVLSERILIEPKVIRNRTSPRRETGDSPHRRSFFSIPHVVSNLGWTRQP